jgi:hypothetical protein
MKHSQTLYIVTAFIGLLLYILALPAMPILAAFGEESIFVHPERGQVGDEIEVSGSGFHPSHYVYIFFSSYMVDDGRDIKDLNAYKYMGSTRAGSLGSADEGEFEISFDVPDELTDGDKREEVVGGIYYVYASYDDDGDNIVDSDKFFTRYITLDPEEGNVGDTVEISGGGFRARSNIRIKYDGDEVNIATGDTETDREGFFNSSIIIPNSSAGTHPIEVDVYDKAKENFIVKPRVAFTPKSGGIGDEVTVSGDGFGQNKELIVYINYVPMSLTSGTAETGGDGSFASLKFKLPTQAASTYEIMARDSTGNSAAAAAKFTLVATANMNPISGNVGTMIMVSGTGFAPGSMVTVKYDDGEIDKTIVNLNATFSTEFSAPASEGGNHTVTISGTNIAKQFTFDMESSPPAKPVLVLSADTNQENSQTLFDWEGVTDPSLPITYSLQISSNQDFTSIVLEKRGLINSEYTLTEKERLPSVKKEAPYYWRVKAIDNASNESEWSAVRSFYVSSIFELTPWLLCVLIALSGVVLVFTGFSLRRRTTHFHQ